MTPLDLSQAVLALRVMIERDEQVQDILQRVDSIEKGVKRCGRVEEELEGLRTECKKLRSRNKRLERDICKCNEEKEQLVQELERTQDFHRSKIEKLARYAHF
jgi:archaellum component FlaC